MRSSGLDLRRHARKIFEVSRYVHNALVGMYDVKVFCFTAKEIKYECLPNPNSTFLIFDLDEKKSPATSFRWAQKSV